MHGIQPKEEWRQQAVAFLMAGHPRLGEGSPAQVLSPDVRMSILTLVKYQKEIDRWKAIPQEERNQALFDVAKISDVEQVKVLLAAGADVNTSDKFGNTALHEATNNGHELVVKTLLEANADPNRESVHCNTPLAFAIRDQRADLINLLKEYGATEE